MCTYITWGFYIVRGPPVDMKTEAIQVPRLADALGVYPRVHSNNLFRDPSSTDSPWWRTGRAHNLRLAEVLDGLGRHRAARLVRKCHRARPVRDSASGKLATPFPNSCGQPLCWFCARRRRRELASEHADAALRIQHGLFVTFTLPDCTYLDGVAEQMLSAFGAIRRLHLYKARSQGGFYSLEFDSNDMTGRHFHPHLHALLDSEPIAESWFRDQWHRRTGAFIVRSFPDRKHPWERLDYLLKPWDRIPLEPWAVSEIYSRLRHRGLFQAFGNMASARQGRPGSRLSPLSPSHLPQTPL